MKMHDGAVLMGEGFETRNSNPAVCRPSWAVKHSILTPSSDFFSHLRSHIGCYSLRRKHGHIVKYARAQTQLSYARSHTQISCSATATTAAADTRTSTSTSTGTTTDTTTTATTTTTTTTCITTSNDHSHHHYYYYYYRGVHVSAMTPMYDAAELVSCSATPLGKSCACSRTRITLGRGRSHIRSSSIAHASVK